MENQEKTTFGDKIWTACFAIMYPIITVFGLIITGILAVFSLFSRIIANLINAKKKP